MNTTTFAPELAAEGMKLLAKKDRERLHPRAQVQKLRRIAVRATSKVDWLNELHARHGSSYTPDATEVAKLERKALVATEAMKQLNAEHGLGY